MILKFEVPDDVWDWFSLSNNGMAITLSPHDLLNGYGWVVQVGVTFAEYDEIGHGRGRAKERGWRKVLEHTEDFPKQDFRDGKAIPLVREVPLKDSAHAVFSKYVGAKDMDESALEPGWGR